MKPDLLRRSIFRLHGRDFARILSFFDLLIPSTLFWLIPSVSGNQLPLRLHLPGVLLVLLFSLIFFNHGKIYQPYRQTSLFTLVLRITVSWFQVLTALLLVGFATKVTATFSRLDFGSWALLVWLILITMHVGSRLVLRFHRRNGGNTKTVLFWGSSESALAFYQELNDLPQLGLRLVAWFRPPNGALPPLPPGMKPPIGGGLRELREWLDANAVDLIFFSHVNTQDVSMKALIHFFGDTCKPVFYVPPWGLPSMRFHVEQIGSRFCIGLWGNKDSLIDTQIKRLFDLLLAGAAIIFLAPLFLLIGALVACTSPGPILFRQARYGLNGRRFKICKFRTMTVTENGDQPGLRQASRDDLRITPIGRFLRRWSLDELPQLFNVLTGSMSLVGPRPHAVEHNELYRKLIPGYMQRHQFKPGITGLAQVEGWRGETAELIAMESRIDADLRYQREWSFGLDLEILIKTILHLRSTNAY
ncbi:exopolysaccharide biosynthesis polyprenyl glycosylphosphotransferase [Synechococcus sp. CS-1325]|uniref:exopolysaccharide biosynthesis polyprenyl glycosylphosphotransferase n=1 Tax=unclassified Synechococcus TaxID=2626047 RepID=UPI0021A9228D|nr:MULTISPECIES: exopolysaccharide biosynthesis polyprenyl glycosylphosphotransferase [unclassified Synechococcus]MCT0198321.1 exopolysaccharide biosynthesis polyprenyl glycosylphosphotransferase [Synechococcus sp. CS-1325]MCT0212029.1 exopolysaccharide biosynthesis polyprenyl glycosylphosphotransferase [Synechococcus sp. CS-1326]MCT0232973.1 exopolysaccharide biosynthesis polyprenyl glycosylphosphotransferase [Synechococcus sp. CS-1327]